MQILVVDDNQELLLSLKEILKYQNVSLEVAESAAEALNILQDIQPDFMLIDIRIPDMDGISLLKKVKALYPILSVAMMTGYDSPDIRAKALENGALTILIKPFEISELLKLINRFRPDHHLLFCGTSKKNQTDLHHLMISRRYKATFVDSIKEVREELNRNKTDLLVWEATPFVQHDLESCRQLTKEFLDTPLVVISRETIIPEIETQLQQADISAMITPPFEIQTVVETFKYLLYFR